MKEQREQIAELLQNDPTLLDMLPVNRPWFDGSQAAAKKWSILPMDKISLEMTKPFIGLAAGSENLIGTHLLEDFFYVRCYNANDKTYVDIDRILSRVKVLLHGHRFNFVDTVSIDTLYETTGPELTDQAYDLRFRESRYRLLIV